MAVSTCMDSDWLNICFQVSLDFKSGLSDKTKVKIINEKSDKMGDIIWE